jgi:hypothetical protein
MKNIKKNVLMLCIPLLFGLLVLNSCEKLPLYKDVEYTSHTLDPQQGITAWEYMNKPRTDTLFNMMLRAIKYAGMEAEYKKPNRTYILLANQAITSLNITTGVESTTSYFGRRLINGVVGKKIQDYPVAEIRNLLKYHIVEGYHTYGNLGPNPETFTTLRTDSAVNTMTINITNAASYALQFNNFPRTIKTQTARTSNLQMTENCVVHVLNTYMEYGLTP